MTEPKNAKDMEKLAEELLRAMDISVTSGNTVYRFPIEYHTIRAVSHYLLDAYNEGYDDAILAQKPRRWRND